MKEIPKKWLEVTQQIELIGDELRKVIKDERGRTVEQYRTWLDILTGCYMYLEPLFSKYSALKRNNEDAKYVEIKNTWGDGKFVSAVADREASDSVSKYRYVRDWLEGWVKAAESGIYTCRRHLSEGSKESNITKIGE